MIMIIDLKVVDQVLSQEALQINSLEDWAFDCQLFSLRDWMFRNLSRLFDVCRCLTWRSRLASVGLTHTAKNHMVESAPT